MKLFISAPPTRRWSAGLRRAVVAVCAREQAGSVAVELSSCVQTVLKKLWLAPCTYHCTFAKVSAAVGVVIDGYLAFSKKRAPCSVDTSPSHAGRRTAKFVPYGILYCV